MYTVDYLLIDNNKAQSASFTDLESAQLFWDSVVYLRQVYQGVITTRPR